MNALFGAGETWFETGFTSLALKHMEEPKMLRDARGKYKSIGGLLPAAILEIARRKCLPQMRAWMQLALEVVDTEFPDFELLARAGKPPRGPSLGLELSGAPLRGVSQWGRPDRSSGAIPRPSPCSPDREGPEPRAPNGRGLATGSIKNASRSSRF